MTLDPSDAAAVTVVTATRLEARAVRRALPGVRLVEAGIGLVRLPAAAAGSGTIVTRGGAGAAPAPDRGIVVTCGLAGALGRGLPTGTVLVPEKVRRPNGDWLACDPAIGAALAGAAARLGLEPERGPLATAPALVRGAARATWADRGCVAVDMETGLVAAPRVAAVRVVLDTPERDLSPAWLNPLSVLADPTLWGEALWLWREAPRCARLAAAVLARALGVR